MARDRIATGLKKLLETNELVTNMEVGMSQYYVCMCQCCRMLKRWKNTVSDVAMLVHILLSAGISCNTCSQYMIFFYCLHMYL